MMKTLLLICPLLFITLACTEDKDLTADIESIKYGMSFGECLGYCLNELTVSSNEVYLFSYGWNNSVMPLTSSTSYSSLQYQNLLEGIDMDTFLLLDPVIGCPDCADGGAEWIELTTNGRTKRVTFEFGKEITGLNPAILELRSLKQILEAQ